MKLSPSTHWTVGNTGSRPSLTSSPRISLNPGEDTTSPSLTFHSPSGEEVGEGEGSSLSQVEGERTLLSRGDGEKSSLSRGDAERSSVSRGNGERSSLSRGEGDRSSLSRSVSSTSFISAISEQEDFGLVNLHMQVNCVLGCVTYKFSILCSGASFESTHLIWN